MRSASFSTRPVLSVVLAAAVAIMISRGASAFMRHAPLPAVRSAALAHRGGMVMQFWATPGPSEDSEVLLKPINDKLKSDAEYRKSLKPVEYMVLREKATEPRGVNMAKGGWDDHFEKGQYVCAGCGSPLYDSSHKFDCGCGWPGFWSCLPESVYEERDADGSRAEIMCAHCSGHLGHVFRNEGFKNPVNERHCVNR
jgi:peptide-methionine (R)-S-oxide reductase